MSTPNAPGATLLATAALLLMTACGDDAKSGKECEGGECDAQGQQQRDLSIEVPQIDLGDDFVPPGDAGPEPPEGDALTLIDGSLPPDVLVVPETCPTRDDGVCDEPTSGGSCPIGTDPEDCRGPMGPECSEAAECPPGEFCRLGQCVPSEAERCVSDSDCGATEFCDAVTGMCSAEPPPAGCQRSADCAPGEVCDVGAGTCGPAGGGCEGDADCSPGELCLGGVCDDGAAGGCVDDLDCRPDEICFDGVCEGGGGGGCFDDLDCAPGEICFDGFCEGGGGDFCEYEFDFECDEPEGTGLCAEGTDPADCAGGGDFCEYEFDFECDEPEGTGLCAEGTDPADCAGAGGCFSDLDCRRNENCDLGECVPFDNEFCIDDVDCPAGQICDFGACAPDDGLPQDDGSEGSRCGPGAPFCDFNLSCVGSDGAGTCRRSCNANAAAPGCARAEICVPSENCDPDAFNCSGFCFADDDCRPGSAVADCGIEAYCDVLGRASSCMPAGAGGVGDPCSPPGVEGCQADLACIYGRCVAACDAMGACAGAGACLDLSVDFGGAFQICLDTCDPYDARSCGALVPCALQDVVQAGAIGLCIEDARQGRGVAGDECQTDDAAYWGTCDAAHLCGYANPAELFGQTTCVGLCDANSPEACAAGTACIEGTTPLPGLGLCLGQCDPTAAESGCADAENCRPIGAGPLGDGEGLAGVCSGQAGRLPLFENCFAGFDGASDCADGTFCAEEERFIERCLPLCDTEPGATHPCPMGSECVVGGIASLLGDGDSERWGVCVRAMPAPRCPLPEGEPVPAELCNNVDDDCDGQSDNGPAGDRQLDCPEGEQCLGGSCF